jgi:ATP phosphoribosyltransferase
MAVAAVKGWEPDPSATLRVATKFPGIATDYFASRSREIEIIHLNGSIEIAPLLGLSDVIVDIVETGKTLAENNLEVVEEIVGISARLVANKAAYRFRRDQIDRIVSGLKI